MALANRTVRASDAADSAAPGGNLRRSAAGQKLQLRCEPERRQGYAIGERRGGDGRRKREVL